MQVAQRAAVAWPRRAAARTIVRADDERQEQLEHRDVEGQRRDREQHVVARAGRARARMLCRKFTTARCGTRTPLGLPVEPEV